MNKKIIFGNLIGILSLILTIIGFITLFKNPIIGTILTLTGFILLFVAIYIHELIIKEFEYDKPYYEPTEIYLEDELKREKEAAEREKTYEIYLDAKTALMVDAFAILTDKRMNKETRARKLRKIIRSNPFNVDKFEE